MLSPQQDLRGTKSLEDQQLVAPREQVLTLAGTIIADSSHCIPAAKYLITGSFKPQTDIRGSTEGT